MWLQLNCESKTGITTKMCGMPSVVCPGRGEGHGSWAAEDSVSAEKCKEGSGEEEISGCRPEECCKSCTGPHLPGLPGWYNTAARCYLGMVIDGFSSCSERKYVTQLSGIGNEVQLSCFKNTEKMRSYM